MSKSGWVARVGIAWGAFGGRWVRSASGGGSAGLSRSQKGDKQIGHSEIGEEWVLLPVAGIRTHDAPMGASRITRPGASCHMRGRGERRPIGA